MAAAWQRVAVLAVAGLLYISALLHGVEAQCGGFTKSCTFDTFKVTGSSAVLTMKCKNLAGKTVSPSIDVNRHLRNDNGNLRPGSSFVSSCKNARLVFYNTGTAELLAECTTIQGKVVTATYDINKNISNNNGKLVWNQCSRDPLPESDDKALDDSTPEGARKALFT